MWAAFFFTLLLAGATAEYGWKPHSEYLYEVNTKTLASLNQISDHYTGIVSKFTLSIVPKSDSHLRARILSAQYAEVNMALPQGLETIVPEEHLRSEPLTLSNQPFEVKLKKGVVEELVVSKHVPVAEVNLLRAVVSQLQVDTQGRKAIQTKFNSIPKENENTALFKVMEDTVEGECETLYDITPLPKYVLQTMPQLAPQPQLAGQGQIIDVVKSRNFSNCERRPGYHFGLTGLTDWEPTTNKMGTFLSRSSVSRVILSGSLKSYTIQSSVTTNKVVLSPEIYNSQKGEVVSRVNVSLTAVRTPVEEVPQIQDAEVLKKLTYDYNCPWHCDVETREKWNRKITTRASDNKIRPDRSVEYMMGEKHIHKHIYIPKMKKSGLESTQEWHQNVPSMTQAPESPFLPYFVGYGGHSIQSKENVDITQVAKKLAQEIGTQLKRQTEVPKENTLARFTILTRVLRTMDVDQMERLTKDLYVPDDGTTTTTTADSKRNAWMAYRDALVQAGTGPALLTIVNLITTQKVKGEEAAQVISPLSQTARFPTTEYMNTFFELIKTPEVQTQENLNTSAIYTFTNLVRMAQVNQKTAHNRYPVHAFGYLTSKDQNTVSDIYIPYFAQQLEKALKEGYSPKIQTYIRAIGNIAHPKIIEVFEPYLNGKYPMTDFQRTLMVVSLNKLAVVHPKLAQSVLYKTYANTGEVYQVRVAAVYNLMKTVPPATMLQRMAQFTHDDPSNQVRSAVKSAIESAADLSDEHHSELRKNAEAAVHLLTPQTFGVQYSQHNLTDYITKGLNLGYVKTLSNIGSEDTLIPQTVFFHLNRNMNGFKHQTMSAGGMVSSFKDLGDLLDEKFKYDQYLEKVNPAETKTEKGFTIETISNILNMKSGTTKQLEGNILIGLTGFNRFITFDNTTIEHLPTMLKELVEELGKEKTVNYQKLYDEYTITIGLPVASGLPLVYTLSNPTLLSAKGKVKANVMPEQKTTKTGVYVLPDAVNVTTEMLLEYSTRTQSKISFITPFNHKRYVAAYDKNTQVEIPVKKLVNVDLKNQHVKLEIKPLMEKADNRLFHYSTWPYVGIDNIVDFKPVAESNQIFRVKSQQLKKYQHQLGNENLGIVFRLQGESDRDYFSLKTFYQRFLKHGFVSALLASVASENLEHTVLELYYDGQKSTANSLTLTGSYQSVEDKNVGEQTQTTENDATPTVKTVDSHERKMEFLKKVRQGIKGSSAAVVDLGVQVEGQTKSEMLLTLAYATSPIDGRSRILTFTRSNVKNKNFEVCLDVVSRLPMVSVVDFGKILKTDLKGDVHGKVHFGEQCQTGSKVTVTGDLRRSHERKEYLEKLPVVEEAKHQTKTGYKLQPAQIHASKEAGILDDYTFTIKYENVPDHVKELTYQTYSALRYLGYPYLTENVIGQTNLQEGQIELGVNFTPDLKAVDVYLYTPLGDSKFSNIYLNKYLAKGMVVHPMYSAIERIANVATNQKYGATCTVDQSKFRTFDNNTYSVKLENIWHVMLFSDLKGTYETTVPTNVGTETTDYLIALVKNTPTKQKVLKLVVKGLDYTVIDVTPTTEGEQLKGRVTVNGEEIPVSTQNVYERKVDNRNTIFQIYGLPTGEVRIVSPVYKFGILYYGDTARVTVNQNYMNNVKGLCGTNNGDIFDFVTPQDYVLHNPEEFAATWALTNEGRIGELKNLARRHAMQKSVNVASVVGKGDLTHATHATQGTHHGTQYEITDTTTSHEETDHVDTELLKMLKNSSPVGCVTTRVHVLDKDGKHCFSLHPQPTCTHHCRAETTQVKTAEFYCIDKSSTSTHWQDMIARGANPDFRNKGKTQEREFLHPTRCVTN